LLHVSVRIWSASVMFSRNFVHSEIECTAGATNVIVGRSSDSSYLRLSCPLSFILRGIKCDHRNSASAED
jgi:hypothetical protein